MLGENLPATPRRLPLLVTLNALFIESGALRIFNLIWAIFTILLFVLVNEKMHPLATLYFHAPFQTTTGVITTIRQQYRQTKKNGPLIPELHYRCMYTINGQSFIGAESVGDDGHPNVIGDHVTVEYVPSHPQLAQIKGMRSEIGMIDSLMLAFVIIAAFFSVLILPWLVLARGIPNVRLLRSGEYAVGTLTKAPKRSTGAYGQIFLSATYSFTNAKGKTQTCSETNSLPQLLPVWKLIRYGYPLRVIWQRLTQPGQQSATEESLHDPRTLFAEQAGLLYLPHDSDTTRVLPGQHPGFTEEFPFFRVSAEGNILPAPFSHNLSLWVSVIIILVMALRLLWFWSFYLH